MFVRRSRSSRSVRPTSRANASLQRGQIHNRTIVILQDENEVDRWLDPAVTDPAKLMPLVKPCNPDLLVAYPVQYESLESPDCIQPIGEAFEMNDPRTQSQIDLPEPPKKKVARKKA